MNVSDARTRFAVFCVVGLCRGGSKLMQAVFFDGLDASSPYILTLQPSYIRSLSKASWSPLAEDISDLACEVEICSWGELHLIQAAFSSNEVGGSSPVFLDD